MGESKQILNTTGAQELLELYRMSTVESLDEIIRFAVEKCMKISKSKMGFIGFITEDETKMVAHLWSEKAMQECEIENKPVEFSLYHAGIWAEAIRQHKPIIVNDYSKPSPYKKGYPEGHVSITRFIRIPVMDGNRCIMVVCLANKKEPYTDEDMLEASLGG
jgi:GAF domain-containing protein